MTAVVFDFGGVLFRWEPERLLAELLGARITPETPARHWMQQIFQSYGGDWGDFDRGTVEPAALVPRIARRTGLSEAEVQRVVDAVPHELQPQPATVALLRRLHAAGHPLFYLSNMPAPYATHLERTHDFMALFGDGVFSARVHHNKPEPAIFLEAARRIDVPPQHCIVFEDAPFGIEAARRAGMRAVAVCSTHSPAQLAGPHVLAAVRDYTELMNTDFLETLHAATA